jgi:hypothetical protein
MESSQPLDQPSSDLYQTIDSPVKPLVPTVPNLNYLKAGQSKYTEVVMSSQPLDPNTATFGMSSGWQSVSGHTMNAYSPAVGTGSGFAAGQTVGTVYSSGLTTSKFAPLNSSV